MDVTGHRGPGQFYSLWSVSWGEQRKRAKETAKGAAKGTAKGIAKGTAKGTAKGQLSCSWEGS